MQIRGNATPSRKRQRTAVLCIVLMLVGMNGQAHNGSRHRTGSRRKFNRPIVGRGNPSRNAQAEATPLDYLAVAQIASKKRIENSRQLLWRDPGTRIGNG